MSQQYVTKVLGPSESDPTPDEIRKGCKEARMLRQVSIAEFIEERCQLDYSGYILPRELHDAYREYCHATGRPLAASVIHTRPLWYHLRNRGVTKPYRRIDGKRKRIYRGVRLIPDSEFTVENDDNGVRWALTPMAMQLEPTMLSIAIMHFNDARRPSSAAKGQQKIELIHL